MKVANTEEDFLEISSKSTPGIIQSPEEWKAAISETEYSKESVFSKCSDDALKQWEQSAEYMNGGLAHGDYTMLAKELSWEDLERFFSLFGIGPELLANYKDKYCEGRGTCASSVSKICTSNCRS